MIKKPKVLIITGNGLNCEKETEYAFNISGAKTELVHITDILRKEKNINNYNIISFIGGFSNGDHLGAGTVQATYFRNFLFEDITKFIDNNKLIIGICNGFQTLLKMGILPGDKKNTFIRKAALIENNSSVFEDRWVYLKINKNSKCIWTKGIDKMFLPVRHGEGNFYIDNKNLENINDQIVMQYSNKNYIVTDEYPLNPNGSINSIAAICDPKGLIFGIMPHPEAYLFPYNHPYWTRIYKEKGKLAEYGEGVKIFKNAVEYIKNN